jgi:hypothetical protein
LYGQLVQHEKGFQLLVKEGKLHNLFQVRNTSQPTCFSCVSNIQGGSNMTGTNCDLFTHKLSRSYLNHLVSCRFYCS